jgi:hypothetical protein
LSADGETVAIGAPFNSDGGADAGQTRVYRHVLGSWTKLGSDIDGAASYFSVLCVFIIPWCCK